MKALHAIAFILVIIGGLNWGLQGLGHLMSDTTNWNVVNLILGTMPTLENIVYVLVGLSAVGLLFTHKKDCRNCSTASM
jgi:uncharacterized protein